MRKVRLGDYIEQCNERNLLGSYGVESVRGISINKVIIETKADMTGVSLFPYKLLRPREFAFVTVTSRNGEKISLAQNTTEDTFIVSSSYEVFRVKNTNELLPELLYLWFTCQEFDRYARFHSWGSARETFSYEDMERVEIPLPSIEIQKELVASWQGLKELADNNSQMADPLFSLCRSYLKDLKRKFKPQEIGPYITRIDERNRDNQIKIVKSVSVTKEFKDTNAKVDKNKLQNYKIVLPGQASFVQTTGNEKCLCFAVSHFNYPIVVTAVNEVIQCDESKLLADFLYLWIYRKEFDRYARYHSWGSVRELFKFDDMCRVKIPLPPIEDQKAIVAIYRCAQENKALATEAKALSKDICPALMRQAMEGDQQ